MAYQHKSSQELALSFIRVWLAGYGRPARFIAGLRHSPAPLWGLLGAAGRAAADALLLYLPLALLGRAPSTPSALTFIPTERYYATSVWLAPAALLVQWLYLNALLHLALRLLGRHSDLDLLMNLTGMTALVVGAFLLPFDWLCLLARLRSPVLLGAMHLAAAGWGIVLMATGLRRLLGAPIGLAVALSLGWVALGLPLAMLLIRPPV